MAGDATLFIRRDEVETAWQIVDGVRQGWEGKLLSPREFYAAGTWGPMAADDLLAQNGHLWREPLVVNEEKRRNEPGEPGRLPAGRLPPANQQFILLGNNLNK